MSRAKSSWERLVNATLQRDRAGGGAGDGGPGQGSLMDYVPSSLSNNRDIDAILRAADELQDEDPSIARILCEHAYSLAQNLDPNSVGRGVLQFKTGLMSVVKQRLAKREVGTLDRSQDSKRLQDFYMLYREKNNVDTLKEEETQLRESGVLTELERKTVQRKRLFATLKILGNVLEQIAKEIPDELKQVIDSDAAISEDTIAYNIIPLGAHVTTNAITDFPEVQAAVAALKYFRGLPKLPANFPIPAARNADMLDFLHYIFGFQKDSVSNQREHIILLLANEQSRLNIPEETEPKLDDDAVHKVFLKSLDNYIKWCDYLCIKPAWINLRTISGEKKLLFLSLYFLIWGEAANIRFLPECLCYIFHHMVEEMNEILRQQVARPAVSCMPVDSGGSDDGVSFLEHVIAPLYEVVSAEAFNNENGRAPHSSWRNYDDFNEYFWSLRSFELGWPWRTSSSFFQKPIPRRQYEFKTGREKHLGKTSFVEHRTFLHLYHSFHRLWIFLAMMFQALAIIAFNKNNIISSKTLREILSLGPTYIVMKFSESVLDVIMMYGAYSTTRRLAVSRIFLRFIWFSIASVFICFLYVKVLQEDTNPIYNSVIFRFYGLVIAVYGGIQFFLGTLMHIPTYHNITNKCDRWGVIRFFKWMRQERYYVGRGMYERTSDFIKYFLFWLVVLSAKFSFAYFLQIKPLVDPTRMIMKQDNIQYSWHVFLSIKNYNALTVASLWAPVVAIYLLDIHIFYTIASAFFGFLLGGRDRLGEIRSLKAIRKQFEEFPGAFMKALHVPVTSRTSDPSYQAVDKNIVDAAHFAPFWNQIIKCLREEDYITDFEMELLLMPKNSGRLQLVQWPLFLLSSKILLAKEIAAESNSQEEIVERIGRYDYMKHAVEEVYQTLKLVLTETLEAEGRMWVERIYEDIQASIRNRNIHNDFQLNNLSLVITRLTALLGILKENETPEHEKGAIKALQDLYDVMRLDILHINMMGQYEEWTILTQAWNEGRLFTKLKWPKDPEMKSLVKRLYSLFTIKDSATHVPRNLEARRRLQFFTNSLFMDVPPPKSVDKMLSFSVFTPYYSEVVLYSMAELTKRNEDGISILFYLQKIYPDEWKNFLARIGQDENALEGDLRSEGDILELRFWASYRGQTLARTVRGMMYYRKALMLQSYLERKTGRDGESTLFGNDMTDAEGFELSPEARAQADLKFTYVVTCQIYGRQKEDHKPAAVDIGLLMQRNEALRIAYIDVVDTPKEGKSHTEYYSKLVKAGINGKDKEIYSIRLPGDPKLGEGKPENQNHAIVFTRGNALQTIDMNQDNYFEEALKMRNLLEEFDPSRDHGIRPPTILGVREHVFTGSVSSLASFMSNQETSFVTLGQRVLAKPLKIRMHYGHPDVFDRVFHITRGGISKASRVINISEDIFAGFNSTLRQGNITHHEYIQVGKGRDVGLNQIALFEGKVAGGNGEQVLSRDVYRLGQLLDFFRMMSFYFTTVGFYFCTMLTVLTVYIFLYGRAYLALSGVGDTLRERALILNDTALTAALNAQFLFQIGVFAAVPMILGFILEQGFLQAIVSFTTMQFQLCTVFFTFSLGTRAHYFGRTLLHGGARYQATGRGFVVKHITFSENYRLYSRSHFVKGMEVILLLVVYLVYGNDKTGAVSYILLTVSSWFLAGSWLFAPYLFNPAGLEWQKVVQDFTEWTNWLFYRGGIGVKGAESWEAWWEEELSHIRTLSGRIVETVLSLRFFIFQYGIVYKLKLEGSNTSFTVYGWSWVALAMMIVLFKVFTFSRKISVNFQLVLRFVQGFSLLAAVAGITVAIVLTDMSVTDIFASLLAFIPTGWGILSIACAWKPYIKRIGLWKSIRSLARLYDAGMGMLIFLPVAFFSWFPFFSTFQTRLMFNQAFSRGLEISLILAGNNPSSDI
ncbi:Callose synthase 9 [Hirschfeldia incana]|nr:Callose synthase 9 [Hirschfeldia incana]